MPSTTTGSPRESREVATAPSPQPSTVPVKADGLDLIGRYASSGFVDPPFLVRRAEGSTVQLPELLFHTLSAIDGERDLAAIADRVSEEYGRRVTADNVAYLIDEKLAPMGLAATDGDVLPEPPKKKQLLALTYRAALIPERVTLVLARAFGWLFHPLVVAAVLAAAVAIDVWLFGTHGVGQTLRETVYQPMIIILVFGLVVVSAAFHEIGHAAACHYSGARPGRMGAGLYLAWPVFYTDVTDAYRLDRRGRLRTDLGGVYFNVVFILLTFAAYHLTGFEPLLVLILVQHLEIAHQLLPFVRLDGYYIVADITGVPDLFSRIGPILKSFIPGRDPAPQVTELKPWARWTATAWALLVVPLLLFNLGAIVLGLPRILSTAYDSALVQWDQMAAGGALAKTAGVVQLLALALPIAAIVLMLWKLAKRSATATWELTDGRPALRTGGVAVLSVAAIGAAFTLWPNGEYRPLQQDERWNISEARSALRQVSTGRPSLTPDRQEELAGAPSLRDQGGLAALRTTPAIQETSDTSADTTSEPATDPTPTPTPSPSASASTEPTSEPTATTSESTATSSTSGSTTTSEPTSAPTSSPSPSASPSPSPSPSPTSEPTTSPSSQPSPEPTPTTTP